MTVADQLRQEGVKEATFKMSGILVKQLNRRFGGVSPMLKEKLRHSHCLLERIARHVDLARPE